MKFLVAVLFLFSSLVYSNLLFAKDISAIEMDLKFLCEIKSLEKKLAADKTISAADLAMRIYRIREASLETTAAKKALEGFSQADPKEQPKLWKAFAKDNGVKTQCF